MVDNHQCLLIGEQYTRAGIPQSVVAGFPVLPDAASRVRPSSEPPLEGIFPLALTWALTLFPKAISDESINQGLVCAHMHSIARTQKVLTPMP